jgi:hypothetical protein
MATNTVGKGEVAGRAKQLIAGAEKLLTGTTALVGTTFTPAEVTSKLQAIVDLRADVENAQATVRAKLAAEAAEMPALRVFMSAFVSHVKAAHGTSPEALAAFGIHPKARAPLTVEAQAAAIAKRAATRAARHTMGPKQKKGIKGDVTGVVVTPITAPPPVVKAPAPSAPTAPATSVGITANGAAATPHTG